jgi:hypothetical protein
MSALTASLPMYNLPEMAAANAAFWRALSAELADAGIEDLPPALAAARPPVPDEIGTTTLFSQTCGYPLQTIYRGQYQLLGVPTYDADGCGEATHCAFILVREGSSYQKPEDLRGTSFQFRHEPAAASVRPTRGAQTVFRQGDRNRRP